MILNRFVMFPYDYLIYISYSSIFSKFIYCLLSPFELVHIIFPRIYFEKFSIDYCHCAHLSAIYLLNTSLNNTLLAQQFQINLFISHSFSSFYQNDRIFDEDFVENIFLYLNILSNIIAYISI